MVFPITFLSADAAEVHALASSRDLNLCCEYMCPAHPTA